MQTKNMQKELTESINSVETYAYGTSKNLVCKIEEIKYNEKINQYKK